MTALDSHVLVVGAGFAGMSLLARLRDRGFTVAGVERGEDVGGTWYWSRYPGLHCDIESMHYSYAWDPDLQDEWEWTNRYATGAEIHEYARHVAERYDLRPLIRFGTAVTALEFDEESDTWTARFSDGSAHVARWVVLAIGTLSTPKPIDLPGAADFNGRSLTTTDWPSEEPDLSGDRVALIGTGSSGIQTATAIADRVGHLSVCQRTASYTMPAHNRRLSPEEVAEWKADYARIREEERNSSSGIGHERTGKLTFEVDVEARRELYEKAYRAGTPFAFFAIFEDGLVDEAANATIHEFWADKIRERVDDPETAEKLVPSGYPIGTRRCCIDNGYYEIFNSDHVDLVDIKANPIERVEPAGLRLSDGSLLEVDTIVHATGYDAFTGTLARIDIRGEAGRTLAEDWADGPETNLGLQIAGYPNLFLVTGPQSPSVLSNMMVSIEQHVEMILAALDTAREAGAGRIGTSRAAQEAWMAHCREVESMSLFRKADSWYSGTNVPGKPRIVLPYVGGVGVFREVCTDVMAADWKGFEFA
ncbi:flavin-containing monooxygenase [Brevibacterium litoralis]|uniref:flavin-containing monooxygenase n=1 Tax=Brevibacterium litoralis TaxID=3138935 RepID=UPI0032F08EB7